MPGLDYIKGYDEGGNVQPTTEEEKTPTVVGKAVPSKSKYALPTTTGAAGVDESILQKMQELIAQREAQKGSFMESLRDAQAWWSGGMAGPGEALARRAKEREEQEATTFGMRRDLAQYRVSQEQARALDKQLFGTPQIAQPTAPQTTPGAAQPQAGEAQAPVPGTGGLLSLVKDPGLRQSITVQAQSGDRQGAMKAIQSYLAKNAEDTQMMKDLSFMIRNNLIDPKLIPPAVLTKFVGSGAFVPQDVRGPQGTMQTTPLGAAAAVSPPAAGVPRVAAPTPSVPSAPAAAAPAPSAAAPAPAAAAPTTTAPAPSGAAAGPQPIPPVKPLPRIGAPGAAAPAPGATGAGGFAVGSKEELDVRQAAAEKEAQETATDIAKDRAATVEAGSNSGERLASIQYLNNLLTTNPRAFGVLQKPGVLTAVLGAAEQGANVGNLGAVGIAGISDAVRKAMPGATQADIDAAQKATREFALMQLSAAKIYLKGQGAVSDAERGLIRELAGSVKNSPEALRDFLKWNEIRANFDKKNGAAYREFNKRNPNVSFERYKESDEYQKLKAEYEQNLNQFVKTSTAPKGAPQSHPGFKLVEQYTKPKTTPPQR